VQSGAAGGRRYVITGNTAAILSVRGDLSADGLAPGDRVAILPTVEEYLGNQLASGGLAASDWIAVYATNNLLRLHRDDPGQWKDDTGRPVRLSVACGGGFLVNLLPGSPRTLFLAGEWQEDPGGSVVVRGQQILSVPLTGTVRTLEKAIPASPALGPVAGAAFEASDRFTVLDEATGGSRSAWLDSQSGQWLWQDDGQNAGTLPLVPGKGYLYFHQGDGFFWQWR
jgi:hypothetical protein